jgi:hypothetical protein
MFSFVFLVLGEGYVSSLLLFERGFVWTVIFKGVKYKTLWQIFGSG